MKVHGKLQIRELSQFDKWHQQKTQCGHTLWVYIKKKKPFPYTQENGKDAVSSQL